MLRITVKRNYYCPQQLQIEARTDGYSRLFDLRYCEDISDTEIAERIQPYVELAFKCGMTFKLDLVRKELGL